MHPPYLVHAESQESLDKFTPEQNDRLYRSLQEIVADHDEIIGLCQKMSTSLSPNVLIHYITSAVVTCICCLMVMLAEGAAKLIFVNYIIASTTQVFVYSYGGSLIDDASLSIYQTAYSFHWYKCDERIRKLILMIIMRSQKKTGVDVPFFETSMETFGAVSSCFARELMVLTVEMGGKCVGTFEVFGNRKFFDVELKV